ncbi:hypothetical protein [Amycolatopsis sp. WAC 01376]|uniref:hypothetical protein n=1 Tax=Amycolatopsis sp. WAC 01376 TaxID=2203195 RepID=UPI00131548D0|nr:hypothetical protein [Amycolatopsis sp. WAC 01376]
MSDNRIGLAIIASYISTVGFIIGRSYPENAIAFMGVATILVAVIVTNAEE